MDGGVFKKQLPIPFLRTYVNTVYYVMFANRNSVHCYITEKQLHQVDAENKASPLGYSWRVVPQQRIFGALIHT